MNEFQVVKNKKIKLSQIDANNCGKWVGKKKQAKERFKNLVKKLDELQERLYAENKHKVLLVLQAVDSGGKDGTIRAVFEGVNPQGVRIANFKVPSEIELDHDYLWRIHKQVPGKGEIIIFNRSHYEDVLVVRIHELVPQKVWEKRFQQIVEFERMLYEEGTLILKFYLHIDREEQKKRFLERLENPRKQWKFNPKDIAERKRWDEYMQAYEDAINKTSTDFAPWFVIPANYNWYRNLMVIETIVEKFEGLKMEYPLFEGDSEEFRKQIQSS